MVDWWRCTQRRLHSHIADHKNTIIYMNMDKGAETVDNSPWLMDDFVSEMCSSQQKQRKITFANGSSSSISLRPPLLHLLRLGSHVERDPLMK